ncbi:MAG TPA: acyl-CoA dehydrogenase family protein [Steroidobacteraceae bacterium]|jgi:3-hydroxy-9,10-secoandrosta-1,3,5(10)-triene-9,17-dione monooxygenase|nr:acyl-CoA dehydrogenase family protein [Steroidobacteraceae bacterium]
MKPTPTSAWLLEEARAIASELSKVQDEADARGFYPDVIHQRLLDGGFYRIVQPKMFGGLGTDAETYIRVIMALSQGHPASGWCYTLASSHALVLGSVFGEDAQRELFGADGDFRAAYAAGPAGMPKFERVEGGYVVSGLWPFASGIPVCNHFLGGAVIPDESGAMRAIVFVVGKDKVTVQNDWGGDSVMGMQGSGSNSVRLSEVFIPDRHIAPSPIVRLSTDELPDGTPGTRLHRDGLFLGLIYGWFSCEFGAILTGTARAACAEYEKQLRTKPSFSDPTRPRMHEPEFQRLYGEAMCRADAAEALTLSATRLYRDQCTRWLERGDPVRAEDTMQVWGISREGCRAACEAVEMLFHSIGASVVKRGERLQRYFRDVQMYRVHFQSQAFSPVLRSRVQLGLPLPPPFHR